LRFLPDLWECAFIKKGAGPAAGEASAAKLIQVDLGECLKLLTATLGTKEAIRKLCSELCPAGQRGALVGNVMGKDMSAVQPAEFYRREHLKWLPLEQVFSRFRNLEKIEPDVVRDMLSIDPSAQFVVFYVIYEKGTLGGTAAVAASLPSAPYAMDSRYFSRWRAGAVYMSVDKDTGEVLGRSVDHHTQM
jgi:hypothetical protein